MAKKSSTGDGTVKKKVLKVNTENAEKPLGQPASKNQSFAKKNSKPVAGKRKTTSVDIRSLKEELTQRNVELTISRNLARLLGGDLTATSQINKGSTFTLTLPIRYEKKPVSPSNAKFGFVQPADSHNPHNGSKKRILVIDDDPDAAYLLEASLTQNVGGGRVDTSISKRRIETIR